MKTRIYWILVVLTLAGTVLPFGQKTPSPAKDGRSNIAADTSDGKFALLIGINKYEHVKKLFGSVADVEAISALLQDQKFGFVRKNIEILPEEKATAANMIAAFIRLIDKARSYKARTNKEAVIYFHYSGHGEQVKIPDGVVKPDEPDGYDEAIVPVDEDPLDPKNRAYPLLDDDIAKLVGEMGKYTSNATYVFDSCHSGSVDRGNEDSVTREIPDDMRRQPETQLPKDFLARVSGSPAARGDQNELFSGSDDYVLISGASSKDKAREKRLDPEHSRGALSYYLELELKNATSEMSYRELLNRVRADVSLEFDEQHPQISGNSAKRIFGGKIEDLTIPIGVIKASRSTNDVVIHVGAMNGVTKGTLVAFYDGSQKPLDGNEGKLGDGKVTKVNQDNSTVAFTPVIGRTVTYEQKLGSHAVLLSPLFGDKPLQVVIDTGDAAQGSRSTDDKVLGSLSKQLKTATSAKGPTLFDVYDPASNKRAEQSAVVVQKGRFRDTFCPGLAKTATKEQLQACMPEPKKDGKGQPLPLPADGDEIYYLRQSAGGGPLFDKYVTGADAEDAVSKLNSWLTTYARQRNLLAFDNLVSAIKDNVKVELLEVKLDLDSNGEAIRNSIKKTPLQLDSDQSEYHLKPGTYYSLRITNTSDRPLFVTVLDVSTNGGIYCMYPPKKKNQEPQQPLAAHAYSDTGILRLARPYGLEKFKIIVTTDYSDYSDYAQPKARGPRDKPNRMVDRFMDRAEQGASRDDEDEKQVDMGIDVDSFAILSPFTIVIDR